jgi:predicted O-methyltransferase YrrM
MYEYGTENEIATNATIFSAAIYRFLHPGGRLKLKTSIDCGTRESYLQMKGKDLFDVVWNNLGEYASTGGEASAKYIISHDNITRKDLDGFINQMIKYKIRWAHIDINHNFLKSEVMEQHILAAKYLYEHLLRLDISVDIGVHSLASIPDFSERVLKKPTFISEFNSMNYYSSSILKFVRYLYRVFRCKDWLPQCCIQNIKRYLQTILNNNSLITSDVKQKIEDFMHDADEYFKDVEPPMLYNRHLSNSSILPTRENLLEHLEIKGGICAEIGTQTGYFAKKIWEIIKPNELHIFDIDFTPFDREYFEESIKKGLVNILVGDSSTQLATFPNEYFDFIYIDGDHSYDGIRKDIEQAVKKIKYNGYIVCNDYTIYSPLEHAKYGVPRAVNEMCLYYDYEIVFLALHKWGYHDVALRHIQHEVELKNNIKS